LEKIRIRSEKCLSLSIAIRERPLIKNQREMKSILTLVSVALFPFVGAILLAGGNDLGMLFLVPAIIYTIKTAA
jgi:hypothetical protein